MQDLHCQAIRSAKVLSGIVSLDWVVYLSKYCVSIQYHQKSAEFHLLLQVSDAGEARQLASLQEENTRLRQQLSMSMTSLISNGRVTRDTSHVTRDT